MIQFDQVTKRYPGGIEALKNLSFQIETGEMVFLAGHSGAGKSTLINLLMRFYDVTGGSILIDGVDIRNIELDDLRQQVGVVLQEPFLFPGTVRDNIAYARMDATFEQIISAAKRANAHDFIVRLSDGYDTYVGERGARLSGGERQRTALCRALMNRPAILLADEPTGSLDEQSSSMVFELLMDLVANEGSTLLMATHDRGLADRCNRIVEMHDGRIEELAYAR